MRNHKRTTPIFLSVLFVLFISSECILKTSIISPNEAVVKKKY
jgi:hypothetical protein